MESKPFKHYIPYIIAGVAGLFLRTVCCALRGRGYTMDGHDILNAVLVVIAVWCLRGIFSRADKATPERKAAQPLAKTSMGAGVCPRCRTLVLVDTSPRQCQWCGQMLDWDWDEDGEESEDGKT